MRASRFVGPVVLILVGTWILVRNLGVALPHPPEGMLRWWPGILLALGLFLVLRSNAEGEAERRLVPWIILTIYGAFFLLVPLGVMAPEGIRRFWGVFPGAVGIALAVRYVVSKDRHPGLALPAVVLLAVGVLGLLGTSTLPALRTWWPVILIAVGGAWLLRRRR